jgi:hypothetical protein
LAVGPRVGPGPRAARTKTGRERGRLMRFAIFVAVVAAHIVLLWLFPSLRRLVLLPVADEPAITPVFLPPPAVRQEPPQQRATKELRSAVKSQTTAEPDTGFAPKATAALDSQPSSLVGPPSPTPDWRTQAEVTAQANALHIVEAEDKSARQAAALTAHFKPLPGPRVRGPEFGWDYAATHRITHPEGGGLLIALNDRCAIFIFLLPMIGCSIGPQPPANGDLFKYMHKPVKFGDWDWRLDDP